MNVGRSTALGAVCAALLGVNGFSATPAVQKGESATRKGKESPKRVPAYYAKVGLTAAQREKIQAIQAKYDERIRAIEKRIADERDRLSAESEAVLTPEQRGRLERLRRSGGGTSAEADSPTDSETNKNKTKPKTKTKNEPKRESDESPRKKDASSSSKKR